MKYQTLYIIGNGFDIHHGIESSYKNYLNCLKEENRGIYQKVIDFYGDEPEKEEWWNEFEENIGHFDLRSKIEDYGFQNQPTDEDIEKMRIETLGGAYDAEDEVGGIISCIKETFHKWVDSLKPAGSGNKIKIEDKDGFFINFNYSLTLENVYNIPKENILHIHGSLNDDEYVIGHGRSYKDVNEESLPYLAPWDGKQDPSEYGLDAIDDEITENARIAVVKQVMKAAKPVEEIIRKNNGIFKKLKSVKMVYIYGLSFSDVDKPYLVHILKNVVSNNINIESSYYSENDKKSIEKFACEQKLKITLILLQDKQEIRQLRLF